MFNRFLIVGICALLILAAVGCSEQPTAQDVSPEDTSEVSETTGDEIETTKPDNNVAEPEVATNPEELYEQITTGMSYEEVMAIMAGHEPFLENEGAVDTPMGQITTQNVSWKIGDSIITAIFQDGELLGKDLTKM